MEEIWKEHHQFGNKLQFSNLGRLKSFYRYKDGRILKNVDIDIHGYLRVKVNGTRLKPHRYIAELFVPNPENKPEVNHKDGNKLNNCASNLEWSTRSENQRHAYKIGLQKPSEKQKQAVSKWNKENRIKKVYQYNEDNNLVATYNSQKEASEKLGIKTSTVSRILHGQPTNRHNYILKYN